MKNRNVSVGLFVLGGLLLFGGGMFLIGDRRQAFRKHAEYYSEFANIAGLASGSNVRVGGMDAGRVVGIVAPDSPASRFRVRWTIDARLRGLIRVDSLVTIETEGVVGGTYLSVRPGGAQSMPAAALSAIPSKEPAELSELLRQGNVLLNEAQATLKTLGGKVGETLDTVSSTISNVNEIAVGLKQGRGTAGMLLRDDALAQQVRHTIANTGSNLDQMVGDLKAGRGAAGVLLRDEAVAGQIREAIRNVQLATADLGQTSRQVNAMVSDLNSRQIPQKAEGVLGSLNESAQQVRQMISEIAAPDRQGMTAGANIRESLTNANAASANLAAGTEALKHNFLVRGFFRSRGYYNLDHIPPEAYRKDSVFTSRANYRAWISAFDLFQTGSDGREELSASGKALLDGALAEYGEGVVESPIVIEGYCGAERPAEQLALSRSRAILVRQYLQSRFYLTSGNLGIVAMRNSPPRNVGQSTWDGVCIVVLRRKAAQQSAN
jgi:phospholipid/cholesterol/gamma-HCH transport system substrate-binding protein